MDLLTVEVPALRAATLLSALRIREYRRFALWCTLSYRRFAPGSTGASRCGCVVYTVVPALRAREYRRFAPSVQYISYMYQRVVIAVWLVGSWRARPTNPI